MAAKLSGSGSGRYDLGQNSEINVTRIVDVMLVLLIIFMVAAPLATVSIKLDQPRAAPITESSRPPTWISISDSGELYVGSGQTQRPTTLARLPADLAAMLGVASPTAERIVIRADRHVRYGRFMAVMNALKLAGYARIGLINEDLD